MGYRRHVRGLCKGSNSIGPAPFSSLEGFGFRA